MIFVYVLKSCNHNFRYIGITNNIARRIEEHNAGKNASTSFYKPFLLVYNEEAPDYKSARKREIFLKSGKGRAFLDTIK